MNSKLRELFEPRELVAALWPYRYSCFFLTHCNARSKNWRALYAIFVTSFYLVSLACHLIYAMDDYEVADVFAGYSAIFAQGLVIPVNTIVWFFVGHACFMESISSLTHIDRELVDVCSKQVNFKAMVFKQVFHFVFSVFFYFLLTPFVDVHDLRLQSGLGARIKNFFFLYYSVMVNSLVMSVFVDFVYAIDNRYALINSALADIRDDNNSEDEMKNRTDQRSAKCVLETIHRLRIVHRKLFTVSETITKGFSVQFLIFLLFIFFTTVHNFHRAYKIYTLHCREPNATGILIEFYRFVTTVGITTDLLYACHRAVREAKRTANLLDSLINHSDDVYLEVSTFHHQLIHCELQFSPFGFLRLNLSTLQSIAGAVTTYLVFLIQADPEFKCTSIR